MKKLSIVLVLVFLLSLFTACSDRTEPSAAPSRGASSTQGREGPSDEEFADVHPMLFHVTGENGREMYLFGTIHVGDERNDAALRKLTPFLEDCDALAVEFDIVAYEGNPAALVEAGTAFVLPYGTTVEDYMPDGMYEEASALLKEAGLAPGMMKSYNLAMWSQLVDQAALMTKSSLDMQAAMDRKLIEFCYEKQIPVRDVESAELQFGLLSSFSDELCLLMIRNTLDSVDDYGTEVDALYSAWLDGSYDNIVAVLDSENEGTDFTEAEQRMVDDYNNKMLTQRNLGMRDKALEWLTAGDKVFFAVGAAHLVDEDGLVALLRAAGYTVEQVKYE